MNDEWMDGVSHTNLKSGYHYGVVWPCRVCKGRFQEVINPLCQREIITKSLHLHTPQLALTLGAAARRAEGKTLGLLFSAVLNLYLKVLIWKKKKKQLKYSS